MTEDGVVNGEFIPLLERGDEKRGELESNRKGSPWDVHADVKRAQANEEQLALPAPAPVVIQQAEGRAGGGGDPQQAQEEVIDKSGCTKWQCSRDSRSEEGITVRSARCASRSVEEEIKKEKAEIKRLREEEEKSGTKRKPFHVEDLVKEAEAESSAK